MVDHIQYRSSATRVAISVLKTISWNKEANLPFIVKMKVRELHHTERKLHEVGLSMRKIANEIGCSPSTVSYTIRHFKNKLSYETLHGRGRKKSLSKKDQTLSKPHFLL